MFHSYVARNCVEVVSSWQFIRRLYSQTKTLCSAELFSSSRFLNSCLRHHDFDTWLIIKQNFKEHSLPQIFRKQENTFDLATINMQELPLSNKESQRFQVKNNIL